MTHNFLEDHISQIPALQLLMKIGYTYLTPTEAMEIRGDNRNVLLDGILLDQLKRMNRIQHRGQAYEFSEGTFTRAIEDLKKYPLVDGLIRSNEKIYNDLTLGVSFEETIGSDRKSYSFHYIDFVHPENNVYHVTEEFEVLRPGRADTYRPDIVLFVNGIPLAVIECKRPDLDQTDPLSQAISQHLRNQKADGIPELFKYSQLLFAICGDRGKYGTTGTEEKYWSVWKEKELQEGELYGIKNRPLSEKDLTRLFGTRFYYVRDHFKKLESNPLQVTDQDRTLYCLCRPDRLIELTYRFLLYDGGVKKVTRYQQYFAVKKTIERVRYIQGGKRQGGVIYHTQGSGKSLTMVMLAKSLALEPTIPDPRIILVTDRIDLDQQLKGTFVSCGLVERLAQAQSGKHLLRILKSRKASIITTLIGKFETLLEHEEWREESPEIFVLVDESHRSQYGIANKKMMQVLPNACYIGFTGTPLLREEKNTAAKFGGFIDKYTILQGVTDEAIVPLIYEGREAVQNVQQKEIDAFFDRVCEDLSEHQKYDLKQKFARADQLNEVDQKITMMALDITDHYVKNWQGTGFKGQLTASSKSAAIRFLQAFNDIGKVNVEVLISGPDSRENNTTIYEELHQDLIQKFWRNMMQKYGTEEAYNKELIRQFKKEDNPEIIIVVDKLLVGFDAPRNTILYIARSLKEHSLLQAIARVNRLYEGKSSGYIIDYYGVLGNLEKALEDYNALEGFDAEDIEGTLLGIQQEIDKLPDLHAQLWDLFKEIINKKDVEAFEMLLSDEKIRKEFYSRLNIFARTLKIGLSSMGFEERVGMDKVNLYKSDARFFQQLRVSVQSRYSDVVDYRQYEKQIQKLLDYYVSTHEVIRLTEQVNIFDQEAFHREVEKITSPAAKADTIASRTAKHISEKRREDPVFYNRFSRMLQKVIEDFHHRRISELEYLSKANEIMNSVVGYEDQTIPEPLKQREVAQAFYRTTNEILQEAKVGAGIETIQSIALRIDDIILSNRVVDWVYKEDIINRMKQQIDDCLFEVQDQGINLSVEVIDEIIEQTIEIAKCRY
ncbi:MAG: HsdR family type I site-specific deoxyribonuclease [Candidatus Methanomethylophilaceae archaeon]|nr:HsdR family type I site-specific deoxyribonuclease [Candidatus Methanomethylophilaceae archaeon]